MNYTKHPNSFVDEVLSLLSTGGFPEVEELFLKWKGDLPANVVFECEGHIAFFHDDFQNAVDKYEQAISIAPDRIVPQYQYLVGIVEEREGNFVAAFDRYQQAIDTDPKFIQAYVRLGELLTKVGDTEGATRCFRDANRLMEESLGG